MTLRSFTVVLVHYADGVRQEVKYHNVTNLLRWHSFVLTRFPRWAFYNVYTDKHSNRSVPPGQLVRNYVRKLSDSPAAKHLSGSDFGWSG